MNSNIDHQHELEKQTKARKKAERALIESNEKLNRSIDELKDKNLAMVQQEKLASIGLLAAGIAHEINNPIGFVKSNLEVLKGYFKAIHQALEAYSSLLEKLTDTEQSPEISTELDKLRQLLDSLDIDYITEDSFNSIQESLSGAVRVQDIVRNLKDFSRNDEKDARTKCDLNGCIDGAINLVWNEIKLNCKIDRQYGEIPEVYCYFTQLTQVFINIIMNATQAMGSKGEIEIRTYVDNTDIRIEFTDNGPGINEENIIKLFDPFFTTKGVGMGTGLGLYVSHGLIQKHKGSIWAENIEGRGARIVVTLPIDMRAKRTRRTQ